MMTKNRFEILIPLAALVFMTSACHNNSKPEKELSTPVSGTLNIAIDETLQPLAKEEIDAFQAEYSNAHIIPVYKPEVEAMNDFLTGKAEVIMLPRKINARENKVFEARELGLSTAKIAFDAIGLALHKENVDTMFTYAQINDIFSGKIKDWKEIDGKRSGEINVVFDNTGSSTLRYMKEHFCPNGKLPSNWTALKSNPEVIDYVTKNKNAIGVIGVNWISNYHAHAVTDFLSKIKVASIYPPDTSKGAGSAYLPIQGYIAQRYYPLYRDIYLISREGRSGLGSGFMSYVGTSKGQTIILQAGLVPANAPVRLINITDKLDEREIK